MKCSLGPCTGPDGHRRDDRPGARIRRLFVADMQLRHPMLANDNAGPRTGGMRLAFWLTPAVMLASIVAVML